MQVNEQSIQASARLCDAIKWHPCLYDSKSKVFQMKHAVDAAWRSIANECEDTVANCKFRWRIIRKSFAISVRKYGPKNKHYLQEYLDFLVPHVSAIDTNDDGVNVAEVIQIEEDAEEYERDESDDDEHEDDEEVEYEEEHDEEDEEEEKEHEHSVGNDSDTTSAEETIKNKSSDKVKRLRKLASNAATADVEDDGDEPHTGSQTDDGPGHGRRIMRMRRATKRYLESGLYEGRNKERQEEKRARHSVESKKSVASPALEEYDKRKSLANLLNKRVEVKLIKTKLNDTAPEPKKSKSDSADKLKSDGADKLKTALPDKVRAVFIKPDKYLANKDITNKPTMMDSSTTVAETAKKSVNRGTQCDNEVPKTMDEEFLDTIKPQMDLMNSRQKFNFKKRVFQALMDVFDDATNFPNKNEIVELPPTGAPRFDTTTVGELRLMRELVHVVQAAKSTPEIMNATEKVAAPPEKSTVATPPPSGSTDKNTTTVAAPADRRTNSPSAANQKRSETLGLPRHILQKVVKVAGSNGGTILAHEGEKRRVYRIYPKGTLPASVTNSSASSSATIGTFYVTPPKTTTASSNTQTKTSAPSGNAGKPIMFNGKIVNHLIPTTTIVTAPVVPANPNKTLQTYSNSGNSGNSNSTVARHKVTVRTPVGSNIITQRRLSQSGAANNGGSLPVLQNKNVTSTNPAVALQQKSTPTIIRTLQRVVFDDSQKASPSSGLSQIQISQPISLNVSANATANVKSFLESGNENDNETPGETSPNTILPDGGIADDEDAARIVRADGYDPLFIKTMIKNEPAE